MPDIYKDPNPKPEIAIALSDDFNAFLGFMQIPKIIDNLKSLAPELLEKVNPDSKSFLPDFCHYIFNELDNDKEALSSVLNKLNERCESSSSKTLHEQMCLDLVK